ncbi:hypothetical protein [Rhodocaloribacter sp.]
MTATRKVARFGPFRGCIANGVRVGDTLYLPGRVSLDAEGNLVGAGDLAAQVGRRASTSPRCRPASVRRWTTSPTRGGS